MKTIQTLNNLKDIPKIKSLGVQIDFEPQEEEISPSENMEDQQSIDHVIEEYNNGNFAAWFCAKVTVKYRGIEADDYLGCCSYKSFKEFQTEQNGYYQDMINNCINQINKEVTERNQSICKAFNIRKAKQLIAPYGLHIVSII